MGSDWRTQSYKQNLAEIAQVSGIYEGVTEDNLDTPTGSGVLWPRLNAYEPELEAIRTPDLAELSADGGYPTVLFTGNDTYHHGTLTGWDEGPRTAEPICYVEVSPADARALGVIQGDYVRLDSARGSLELPCRVTDDVAPGSVFVPITFPEASVNTLLDSGRALDRVRLAKGSPRDETATLVSVSGAQATYEREA
jgi:formate dehydrogenase major subunit